MQLLQTITEGLYRWRRMLATAAVSLWAVYLAFHVIFGVNGAVAYQQKRIEYRRLQQEVQQIDQDNQRLQQQIRSLKSDPKAIEKEAREQLKYAKPGEVIYVLPAPKPQDNTGVAQKK